MAGEVFGKDVQRLARRFAPLRLLLQAVEALFLLLFFGVAAVLSARLASRLGAAIVGSIGPQLGKSRHVRDNLRVALPGIDAQRLRKIERGCWRTLGAVLAEMPHLGRISDLSRRPPAVEIVLAPGAEGLLDRLEQGEAFLFATAHLANWELLPRLLLQVGGRVAVIYTAQGNPFTDGLMQWLRRTKGVSYVGKRGGVRELLQAARQGQSLGMLVDLRSDEGEPVPFFGIPAMTSTVPARLAQMGKIALVPVRTERLGPARFRVTVEPPIEPRDPTAAVQERARDMTEQLNDRFAVWIRQNPGDWLCTKRRFPKVKRRGAKKATSSPSAGEGNA